MTYVVAIAPSAPVDCLVYGRAIRSDPDVGYEGWHDCQFFLAEAEILTGGERAKAEPPLSAEAWRVPDGGRHRSLSRLRPHLTMRRISSSTSRGPAAQGNRSEILGTVTLARELKPAES